ncbi:MAG: glycosyltransferase family 2 protein [Nibricoccus sp.]
MQPQTPAISVLIPTYNYGRFLPQAIESVLRQDFGDFELIISDDCSPDNTAEILAHYASRDPRVRVQIHPRNLGMVPNWNWCIHQARGKYIKYLFGDDTFAHPSALSRLKNLLDENPGASLGASARLTLDESSNATGVWNDVGPTGLIPGAKIAAECFLRSLNLPGEPSTVIFRREQALRAFDPTLRQIVDLEMWLHLLMQGDFAYTSEPLCCFRIHGQQQTAVNRQNQVGVLEMTALLDRYLPLLTKHSDEPLDPSTKAAILYRALHHLRKKNSGQPPFSTAIRHIESQLSFASRTFSALGYRVRRPLENARRALRQRALRAQLQTGLREQIAFLATLPRTAS